MTERGYLSEDEDFEMGFDPNPQKSNKNDKDYINENSAEIPPPRSSIIQSAPSYTPRERATSSLYRPESTTTAMSDQEQELLREYSKLLSNLRVLASEIRKMNSTSGGHSSLASVPELSDSLQKLERKMDLVFTLMKASVYNIFLQQGAGFDPSDNQYPSMARPSSSRQLDFLQQQQQPEDKNFNG